MKVSVCMITYGHASYIGQAIEGVLSQETSHEIELIIADDTSPDATESIVNQFIVNNTSQIHIKYYRHATNVGAMENLLFAIKKCTGDFIAMCEGDDYWMDNSKIEQQVNFLAQNPQYSLSYTHSLFLNNSSGTLSDHPLRKPLTSKKANARQMLDSKFVEFATSVYPSQVLFNIIDCIKHELKNAIIADTRIFLEATLLGDFHYIDQPMSVYRILEDSASHSNKAEKFIKIKKDSLLCREQFAERNKLPESWLQLYLKGHNTSFINRAYFVKNNRDRVELMKEIKLGSLKNLLPLKPRIILKYVLIITGIHNLIKKK
ncbi:MAG: glycosyltransferase [Nonlabens ulvanivorans]|uniref:glycosyltransferase family 2 protein n=5 Tax=Nonlabens ulvanivorans TaxID=906888 RepID=UPI0032668ABB